MSTISVKDKIFLIPLDDSKSKDDFGRDSIPIDEELAKKGLTNASFDPLRKRIDRIFRAIGDINAH